MNKIESLAHELKRIGFAKESNYLRKLAQTHRTTCMFCGQPWGQCVCDKTKTFEEDYRDRRSLFPGLYLPQSEERHRCPLCRKPREECTCEECEVCGESPINCQCERCRHCGELYCDEVANCECERCTKCDEVIADCECDRCYRCDELESDCECPRCERCGEYEDECSCTNSYFTDDADEIDSHLSNYANNCLINQLGLDLESFRVAVRKNGTVSSQEMIDKNNAIIANLEKTLRESKDIDPKYIQKTEQAIAQLTVQNAKLVQSPDVFMWGKVARAWRDKIASELKKANLEIPIPENILNIFSSSSYIPINDREIEQNIYALEKHLRNYGEDAASTHYNIVGMATTHAPYWGFYGDSSDKEELVIGLDASDVDEAHWDFWNAVMYVFSPHRRTSDHEIAFAYIVNTDKHGDNLDETWTISQVQSDVCDKLSHLKKAMNSQQMDFNSSNWINSFQSRRIDEEELRIYLNDPKINFVITRWKDLLMKKISYAARKMGIHELAMETPEKISGRIRFGDRGKAESIYGDIHRKHGFEPYPYHQGWMGRENAMLVRMAQISNIAGKHNLSDEYMKQINIQRN